MNADQLAAALHQVYCKENAPMHSAPDHSAARILAASPSSDTRPGLPKRSADALVALGDLLIAEHGESCDCDTCLAVQPVVDAALAAESSEQGPEPS